MWKNIIMAKLESSLVSGRKLTFGITSYITGEEEAICVVSFISTFGGYIDGAQLANCRNVFERTSSIYMNVRLRLYMPLINFCMWLAKIWFNWQYAYSLKAADNRLFLLWNIYQKLIRIKLIEICSCNSLVCIVMSKLSVQKCQVVWSLYIGTLLLP